MSDVSTRDKIQRVAFIFGEVNAHIDTLRRLFKDLEAVCVTVTENHTQEQDHILEAWVESAIATAKLTEYADRMYTAVIKTL